MARSSADEAVAAVTEALAPYAWRDFTARMLARRVVGALDRYAVVGFVSGVPGTEVGVFEAVEPAEPDDERVDVLVRGLDGQPWRRWSLARSCSALTSLLEAWHDARDSFDSDLRGRPEGF